MAGGKPGACVITKQGEMRTESETPTTSLPVNVDEKWALNFFSHGHHRVKKRAMLPPPPMVQEILD